MPLSQHSLALHPNPPTPLVPALSRLLFQLPTPFVPALPHPLSQLPAPPIPALPRPLSQLPTPLVPALPRPLSKLPTPLVQALPCTLSRPSHSPRPSTPTPFIPTLSLPPSIIPTPHSPRPNAYTSIIPTLPLPSSQHSQDPLPDVPIPLDTTRPNISTPFISILPLSLPQLLSSQRSHAPCPNTPTLFVPMAPRPIRVRLRKIFFHWGERLDFTYNSIMIYGFLTTGSYSPVSHLVHIKAYGYVDIRTLISCFNFVMTVCRVHLSASNKGCTLSRWY